MAVDKKQTFEKTCCICGKMFTHNHPRVMACSPECRLQVRRQRERERYRREDSDLDANGQKPCIVCGVPFTPWRIGILICSKECKAERDRAQMREQRLRAKAKYWQEKAAFVAVLDSITPFPCPWADMSLGSMPPGVSSWNDAAMTPFM